MAKNEVIDRDLGWRRLRRKLRSDLGDRELMVGIQADDTQRDEGTQTNAMIGTVHEYGSAARNIPERSFLRATIDENKRRYIAALKKLARATIAGKNATAELGAFGERIRKDIIDRIRAGLDPDWADSTLRQKERQGKIDDPILWDTGQLVNAIRSVVK